MVEMMLLLLMLGLLGQGDRNNDDDGSSNADNGDRKNQWQSFAFNCFVGYFTLVPW